MEQQRAQAHLFLGYVSRIGAVQPSAQTNDAIEILATPMGLDFVGQRHQLGFAAVICMPVWLDRCIEVVAVVTNPIGIERDPWVTRIHDALGTDLVVSHCKFRG
ncbi:hypothetical protein D3C79_951350 [compost metagenome]